MLMNQSTIPGTTGYIESKTGYASVELICTVADTTWIAASLRDVVQGKGYVLGGFNYSSVIDDLNFNF